MQHEGRGKMAHILDDQRDQTMPCKGLQAQECQDVGLVHYRMRMPVERYRRAMECQALIYMWGK